MPELPLAPDDLLKVVRCSLRNDCDTHICSCKANISAQTTIYAMVSSSGVAVGTTVTQESALVRQSGQSMTIFSYARNGI